MSEVADNLARVVADVDDATQKAGRAKEEVKLMAVSKTWPVEHVQLAVDAGQKVFGENKVQEGEVKVPALPDDLEWHMVGHLQRNKVRKCLPLFDYLHGLDSLKLLKYMNGMARELNLFPKIFLQVNIGEEPQKNGFLPHDLQAAVEEIAALQQISVEGLMCIPPASESPEDARKWFAATRELRDSLEISFGKKLSGLSMGMSSDYAVAIEEGATIVRVGSSIFGERTKY